MHWWWAQRICAVVRKEQLNLFSCAVKRKSTFLFAFLVFTKWKTQRNSFWTRQKWKSNTCNYEKCVDAYNFLSGNMATFRRWCWKTTPVWNVHWISEFSTLTPLTRRQRPNKQFRFCAATHVHVSTSICNLEWFVYGFFAEQNRLSRSIKFMASEEMTWVCLRIWEKIKFDVWLLSSFPLSPIWLISFTPNCEFQWKPVSVGILLLLNGKSYKTH